MPTDPRNEDLREAILSALGAITAGNGFNYTLTVENRKPTGNSRANYSVVLIPGVRSPAASEPASKHDWQTQYTARCYFSQSEADEATTATDKVLNQIVADVEKKLYEDPTFGGLAFDTILDGAVPFPDVGEAADGVDVNFNVHHRHARGNPYAA